MKTAYNVIIIKFLFYVLLSNLERDFVTVHVIKEWICGLPKCFVFNMKRWKDVRKLCVWKKNKNTTWGFFLCSIWMISDENNSHISILIFLSCLPLSIFCWELCIVVTHAFLMCLCLQKSKKKRKLRVFNSFFFCLIFYAK